jgi:hypothetical protein
MAKDFARAPDGRWSLRMRTTVPSFAFLLALLGFCIAQGMASPGATKRVPTMTKKILIYAQRRNGSIEYLHDGKRYSRQEMDNQLGEWHVDAAKDSGIVVVLEDNLLLSDVKDAPAMALKAGFTDVRVFVYWRGTGNMAEVLFGPVVKVKKSVAVE